MTNLFTSVFLLACILLHDVHVFIQIDGCILLAVVVD